MQKKHNSNKDTIATKLQEETFDLIRKTKCKKIANAKKLQFLAIRDNIKMAMKIIQYSPLLIAIKMQ